MSPNAPPPIPVIPAEAPLPEAPPDDPGSEAQAHAHDAADPFAPLREQFFVPVMAAYGERGEGASRPCAYLCGNSLGLQPKAAYGAVRQELQDWAVLGVEGHFQARRPWLTYHESFTEGLRRLVGAAPGEVVAMGSLTGNLHLMLASFYRPTPARFRIVIEEDAFPTDAYAVVSHAAFHRMAPAQAVTRIRARPGTRLIDTEDVLNLFDRQGRSIALALLPGVQYLTGQALDIARITAAARAQGITVGWDLAHAIGNVPLSMHQWGGGADFAVWCSYKYLNAGPGSPAGVFVHQRHAERTDIPRLAGWFGNEPSARMAMRPDFVPRAGAEGWQLSEMPVLSSAPLRASLELFDAAGWAENLRRKSAVLSAALRRGVEWAASARPGAEAPLRVVTPERAPERGAQVSVAVAGDGRALQQRLLRQGVVCDFRQPDIIRLAPAPLYNSFHDVWRAADALRRAVEQGW
ncbi:MAG: kynureninase [Planctomyces sp.]|nr:kynureninase [Planctomyces sp.]